MIAFETISPLIKTDVLTGTELSRHDIESLINTAATLKRGEQSTHGLFAGKSMVMLFEKPSLRTRLSFEIGFAKLGGHAVYVDQQNCRLGQRETISDVAHNIERFTDVIVARTFSQATVEELAANSSVPVINALSDRFHPCQALADVLTIAEKFPDRAWRDLSIAYIGDGNNVCHSLMIASAILGMNITVITPPQYQPAGDVIAMAEALALESGAQITVTSDIHAVAGHDVVYTDTWISMGDEGEADQRCKAFKKYQVTQKVMDEAAPNAIFMHCLPAYRGKEVAANVIDGPQSVVFDQAENRMHAQNALLVHLLAGSRKNHAAQVWPDFIGAAD
jgi:ornithine carbamoyltransferase